MIQMIAAGKGERGGNRSEYQFKGKVPIDPEPNGSLLYTVFQSTSTVNSETDCI